MLHHVGMRSLSDLGPDLVALRRRRGMTQGALAALVGVKRQQVQRWEASGYRGASLSNVARVADALGWGEAGAPSGSGPLPLAAEGRSNLRDVRPGVSARPHCPRP